MTRGDAKPPRRKAAGLRVVPLDPSHWDEFEKLFGARGACGGCWCMTPRLSRAEYERSKGEGNRRKLKALVDSGRCPGLLAYVGGEPAGWISIEPREAFPPLARSRVLQPVDDRPVWSVTCLFIARDHRGQGLSVRLLKAAAAHAARQGATVVEGYPVEPRTNPMPPVFAYTGIASAFRTAGFSEVARRSPTRPIMRFELRRRVRSTRSK